MLPRSPSIRSNLSIFACWLVNKIAPELTSAEVLTHKALYWSRDCSGRVSGLVHIMAWMHRVAQAAYLGLEDLVKQLHRPPVQLLKGECTSAWLCTRCRVPGWFTCSSQGLPVPRLDQMYAVTLEWVGTVRVHSIMNERARVYPNQQSSFSCTLATRGPQREGDETNGRWHFFRPEAVGLWGSCKVPIWIQG